MKNTFDTVCRDRTGRLVHGKRLAQMAFRAMRGYGQYLTIQEFIDAFPHILEMYHQ